jgi:hypothetical protein
MGDLISSVVYNPLVQSAMALCTVALLGLLTAWMNRLHWKLDAMNGERQAFLARIKTLETEAATLRTTLQKAEELGYQRPVPRPGTAEELT